MPSRIEDYALIGDCEAAALVDKTGSIDWLCLPRFDSGACFAALLGGPEHGRWLITPTAEVVRTTRRYRGDTLVLETELETAEGAVMIVDCMPARDKRPDIVRLVIGLRGEVRMHMELVIRFDYGSLVPWVRRCPNGITAVAGPDFLRLWTPVAVHGENLKTVSTFTVKEGERVPFSLCWGPSHLPMPEEADVESSITKTEAWWREWSARSNHDGPYREAVQRSLVALKALTYAPTGGIVAAPTTSLPEQLGGVRNWDYRFCWLRDATLMLYALMSPGHTHEAIAWRDWLLRALAGSPEQMQMLYGIAGERRLPEVELPWLPGYEGSAPVRVGNAASGQLQLDVYGEVMDALHLSRVIDMPADAAAWALQRKLLEFLAKAWREPDEGIWEVRGPRRHFTHSKVMAWVAFDRGVKAVELHGRVGPVGEWRAIRDAIHADVCAHGFSASRNAFVQSYGDEALDASVLIIPLVGFLPVSDPRVEGTIAAIEKHLTVDGFVMRYSTHDGVDGLPPGEGAFLACSFWLVDNLVLLGRREEATRLFERLLAVRNDVGLLAEEYHPVARRQLGNFPQAFSHLALINSARNLMAPEGAVRPRGETARPVHPVT